MSPRAAGAMLLLAAFSCGAVDSDCIAWAKLVEQLTALPLTERARVIEVAMLHVKHDLPSRYLMAAVNWVESGGTVAGAWMECGSY